MEVANNLSNEFTLLKRDNTEFNKKCAALAEEITLGHLTIVQLIERLGVFLVDLSPNNRELGTWILTYVLDSLPSNYFDSQQLKFIGTFYADRLKDHHQVVPAVLTGVLALTKFQQLPEGIATQILSALFHNVSCQQQQEDHRCTIYRIFKVLLEMHATELCTMGLDYVYGVILAVDGERNPKNLMLLFEWFPTFFKTVALEHLTEEAFEVLACYFPVDFKAPTQDPNAITRDQLADLLAPCLTAVPQFAEFCFPLALEKLNSSFEIAKLDAFKLLELGCQVFDTTSYIQHSTELWSLVQKEVYSGQNAVADAALVMLRTVIKKISNDGCIHGKLKDILDTVKGNLLPDSTLFDSSVRLLITVASASKISSEIIAKEVCLILINTFSITTNSTHKSIILKTLVNFFCCYANFHKQIEDKELTKVEVLCLNALHANNELKKVGFDCLGQIALFLTDDVRLLVFNNVQKFLVMMDTEDMRDSLLYCIHELAKNFPSEAKEHLITNFKISEEPSVGCYFDALCILVSHDYFTDTIINMLLDFLKKSLNLSYVAVHSLRQIFYKYESTEQIWKVSYEKNLVSVLIDWSIVHENSLAVEHLQDIAFILKSIIGKDTTDNQKTILSYQLPKLEKMGSKRVFLLDGILCHLKRDIEVDRKLFYDLTTLVIEETNFVRNTAAQLLANLINKCNNDCMLTSYLEQFEGKQIDLMLLTWITKALLMRNHILTGTWINKLLGLLKHNNEAALCCRVIISDNYDSLSSKSYCIRSFLYQQKFFTLVTNRLNEDYHPECVAYLLAFGYLLENTPTHVVLLQFQKILKLIILCLDECKESEILIVVLQILKEFLVNKETCIENHLDDFLRRFLKLSTFKKSMKVRILALHCLQRCSMNFPIYKLLVHKQEVLNVLGKVIDDEKRIVRREAVEARLLWFLVETAM